MVPPILRILLRQNEKLVNTELVEVMEQVANHLSAEGDVKAAKYLHNWAGKLHHILTETTPITRNQDEQNNAYVELIQALLNCPEGSEEKILAEHKELIDPKLVKIMKQVATQMAAKGDQDTANFLHNLATDLNRSWLESHEFKPTLKKEIAADPWFDDDSSTSPQPVQDTQPEIQPEIQPEMPPKESVPQAVKEPSASEAQIDSEPELKQQLNAIANSLVKLEQILTSRLQPSNPLWYMDILEKATTANWILTTDEVEHLIGIKPQCHHNETTYDRGSWVFIKVGKIGAQTGWQVRKKSAADTTI